jgi:hypothetical protein
MEFGAKKVGIRKKLKEWVSIYEDTATLIQGLKSIGDSYGLSELEIKWETEESQNRNKKLLEKIEYIKNKNQRLEESKALLSELDKQLKELKLEIEKQILIQNKLIQEQKEKLNGIIDIKKILWAQELMINIHDMEHTFKEEKEQYWNAQRVIEEEREKLSRAGLYSLGIEKLVFMNFRRPDRDNPSSVGLDEIYDIREKLGN